MPTTVKVGDAKTRLSELLKRVENGEEFIIARGSDAIARLAPVRNTERRRRFVDTMRAERAGRNPVTQEEIRAWRNEGRR